MKIVILGASGDLSKRKLFPSLSQLHYKLNIIAYARSPLQDTFKSKILEFHDYNKDFLNNIVYVQGDYNDDIKKKIPNDNDDTYLFYLSVPPSLYASVVSYLSCNFKNYKVAIEKPFATSKINYLEIMNKCLGNINNGLNHNEDLSNQDIILQNGNTKSLSNIFLVDHYLLKPIVLIMDIIKSRIIVDHFYQIDVVMKEELGIEGRMYFDDTGIVKDMVQNHALTLYSSILSHSNIDIHRGITKDTKSITKENTKSITKEDTNSDKKKDLNRDKKEDTNSDIKEDSGRLRADVLRKTKLVKNIIGQYNGYCDELTKQSSTETFSFSILENTDYKDCLFTLLVGKGMNEKRTQIRIKYKKEFFKKVIEETLKRNDLYNNTTKNNTESNDLSSYSSVNKESIKSVELVIDIAKNLITLEILVNEHIKKFTLIDSNYIKNLAKQRFEYDDHALVFDSLISNKFLMTTDLEEGCLEWNIFEDFDRSLVYYEKGSDMPDEVRRLMGELESENGNK